jgi:heptosyltransferase-3
MPAALPADARILVAVVARIGDTLLATPILTALKAALPACQVTVWAHPKRLEALQNLSVINRLTGMTKRSIFLYGRLPFGKPFDAALVLGHDRPIIATAARLSRRVAAFRAPGKPLPVAVTDPLAEPHGIHAVDHRLALLSPFDIPHAGRRLLWQVSPAEAVWADNWLDAHLPAWRGGLLLGFQAASFPTKAYRDWPVSHFRELLNRFLATHADGRAVLFGDRAGRLRANEIAAGFGDRVVVLAGQASLRQTAAVMARCAAYAGVDTGPSHIAGALGLPMVVLYHPLHPGANLMPLDHPAPLEAIEHPALAAGDVDVIGSAAMGDIPVESVWTPLHGMLTP